MSTSGDDDRSIRPTQPIRPRTDAIEPIVDDTATLDDTMLVSEAGPQLSSVPLETIGVTREAPTEQPIVALHAQWQRSLHEFWQHDV